jgi:hypothetical protein
VLADLIEREPGTLTGKAETEVKRKKMTELMRTMMTAEVDNLEVS